ncbi:probable 28S ribosomal protein S6, mitochondrial [Diachasma alloeum]|uniref:probable 28S ribosomal protein S6, mitochondrial n=1 Tax=Diachasma alloeum TaxID=454923 RepID=UPI00073828AA|nr:probable 28S ribosomal protein S6, mitochondrial [Diachasma alloeum]
MLVYEMPLILRAMTKPQTVAALKRVATGIFNRGGIIRKIDNLGEKPTPYKMSANDVVHRKASYFILHFNAPPTKLDDFLEECGRDVDLIRSRVYRQHKEEEPIPCTFHEEMLQPCDRPEVQKLMEIASRQKTGFTHPWHWNSGLDYYPFQR